jgi:hypothetical protein
MQRPGGRATIKDRVLNHSTDAGLHPVTADLRYI